MKHVESWWIVAAALIGCGGDVELTPSQDDSGRPTGGTQTPITDARDGAAPGADASQPPETQDAGPDAESPGPTTGDFREAMFGTASDPECDVNGYWVARQFTVSEASLAGDQFASNWYLMAISQQGEDVTVTAHHDCGIAVRSQNAAFGVTVELPRATMEQLIDKNPQVGRRGTMRREGTGCAFQLDRFWSVRGADPATYLPDGRASTLELLQMEQRAPLPSERDETGAEDWNGSDDANPGVVWHISGIASGKRWSVQRDYSEWFSSSTFPIAAGTDRTKMTAAVLFDNLENVLRVEGGAALSSLSRPRGNDPRNKVELLLLGRDAQDGTLSELLQMSNLADRCLAVQQLLPHTES